MTTCSFSILGGDYDNGGSASRNLKEMLKSVGVSAKAIRRVMIAAYEAEMNVVIHASRGRLIATIDGKQVAVDVVDEGPGIPDIGRAMTEGYSTAPARARELGFGAGLGLPNIKRHSDFFELTSTPGSGTRVRFHIAFEPEPGVTHGRNSIRVFLENCRQCLQCIQICPTKALRVHRGVPTILAHLCVDCTACIESCPAGALAMEGDAPLAAAADVPLVLPPAGLFHFGPRVETQRVLEALALLGFTDVRLTSEWEEALCQAVYDEAARSTTLPIIAPACVAVTSLVQTLFPSLLDYVAPYLSPLDAAVCDSRGTSGKTPLALAMCPGQRTSLLAQGHPAEGIVSPQSLRNAIWPLLQNDPCRTAADQPPCTAGDDDPRVLRVTGLRQVLKTLEDLEDGCLRGVNVLELYACEHGCFGSGVTKGVNAALAHHQWRYKWRHEWRHALAPESQTAQAHRRAQPLATRPGLRLDQDMSEAMVKLSRIADILHTLPGRDCGQCGAPTCRHFAEDIALERIGKKACVYLERMQANKEPT